MGFSVCPMRKNKALFRFLFHQPIPIIVSRKLKTESILMNYKQQVYLSSKHKSIKNNIFSVVSY